MFGWFACLAGVLVCEVKLCLFIGLFVCSVGWLFVCVLACVFVCVSLSLCILLLLLLLLLFCLFVCLFVLTGGLETVSAACSCVPSGVTKNILTN